MLQPTGNLLSDIVFLRDFIVFCVNIVKAEIFELFMNFFAFPLFDVIGKGKDKIDFDALAEMLDDGIFAEFTALFVEFARQIQP